MAISPDDFTFVDIEASGLGTNTFPIEIGWTDISLKPNSFLIKPHITWTKEFWNPEAEKIHNISWEKLMDEGISLEEAHSKLDEAFKNRIIISDAPSYEAKWLLRLFETLEKRSNPIVFKDPNNDLHTSIQDITSAWVFALEYNNKDKEKIDYIAVYEKIEEINNLFPHTHRASDDAIQVAAGFKYLLDPSWDYRAAAQAFIPVG